MKNALSPINNQISLFFSSLTPSFFLPSHLALIFSPSACVIFCDSLPLGFSCFINKDHLPKLATSKLYRLEPFL